MKDYFKYIYSDSLDEIVIKQFTYKNKTYEWNVADMLYYNVDEDDDWFEEIPKGAII